MSKKVSRSIWMVTLVVFLASLTFVMGAMYNYFGGIQRSQLVIETQLAARGVELGGPAYLEDLGESAARITWIAPDGAVLYDNTAKSAEMENHLEREEVREALETGIGESSRYSGTLSRKELYYAVRLPDGSVLRLSSMRNTVWTLVLGFIQPIAAVALLALVFSFLLSSKVSKKVVEPINRIDPDRPTDYIGKEEYREVAPLLLKMASQQAELRESRAEMEKTLQIRQEFTANVSHELKTPLQAISGYAELLETGMAREEDVKPFAGKIRAEAQRMTKLAEDIIELTRLDDGTEERKPEKVDLRRIAENAADALRSTAESRGVSLEVSGESAPLYGVPQILYGIVHNLCDNAIKYNRPDGRVEVHVEDTGESVELSVRDTGIGIPEEDRDRIFERFYRVDKSHSKDNGGTGLGLSIVKHGAAIHNAAIRLDSQLGTGTAITVSFPKKGL